MTVVPVISCKSYYINIITIVCFIYVQQERVAANLSVVDQLDGRVINRAGVVIDGKVITSRGLGNVIDFSLAIVSKLFGNARARSVAEGIVYEYPR